MAAAVGVPERRPAVVNVMPVGKVPVTPKVNGAVPPLAVRIWLYPGWFTVQSGNVVGLIVRLKTETVMLCDALAPNESVAVTVKVKLPAAVGVPDSTPVLLSVRPVGSVPLVAASVTVPVPPVVVIVWL